MDEAELRDDDLHEKRMARLKREHEEKEAMRAALVAYRQAQRWATGTEEHRLALQAADILNPMPRAHEQGASG